MGKYAVKRRRGLASLLVSTLLFSGFVLQATVSDVVDEAQASSPCVVPLHGPKTYFDNRTTPDSDGAYLGYRVTPPSTTTNLRVNVDITGNNRIVSLDSRQLATEEFGPVSALTSVNAYFLAQVRLQPNSNPATVTVTVYNGSTSICTFTEQIQPHKNTIKANANKIYSQRVSGNINGSVATVGPGSFVTVTVTGNTGNIGAGPDGTREINLVPVPAVSDLNPAAWQLHKVTFLSGNASCNGGSPIVNRLYLSNTSTPSSTNCGGLYSANYTFKARAAQNDSGSKVQAFAYIASGNLIKHTTPFANVLSLPTLQSNSSNILTLNEPDLEDELDNAPIPFSVNDVNLTTARSGTVTSVPITFFNDVGGLNWSTFCIVNPSNGNCVSSSNVVIADSNNAQTGGTFSISTQADGTRRIVFTANSNSVITKDDVLPAEVEFRVRDNAGTLAVGFASAEVLDTMIANPLSFTAFGTTPTESPTITTSLGTMDTTKTRIWSGAEWTTSPVTIAGVGTWQLLGGNKLSFSAQAGFSGDASIDFRIQNSNASQTAYSTATVTVVGPPVVTPKSASTSPNAAVTLSPTVTAQGNVTRCIYLAEPAPNPCNASSATASSISWLLRPDGVVSFSAAVGFSGVTSVIYGVRDTYGQFASASMTVEVIPPAPPTITTESGTASTAAVVTISPTLTASSSFTICIVDGGSCLSSRTTADGTWTVVGNQIRFQSVNSFIGSTSITARITDATGQTANATQTVVVSAPAAPNVQDASGTTTTTTPKTVTPVVTSPLPTVGCLQDLANPGTCLSGTVNVSGVGNWTTSSGAVTFTADPAFTGTATFSYLVTDTLGRTASATVSIIVQPAGTPQLAATTLPATSVTATTAALNGSVNASGSLSNTYFCYSTNPNLNNCTLLPATPPSVTAGSAASVSMALTGLTAGTEYFFKVVAGDGTTTESGVVLSFSTPVVVQQTPPQNPAPTQEPVAPANADPCVQTLSAPQGEGELIIYFAETFQVMFSGVAGSVDYGLGSLASNNLDLGLTAAKALTNNPLLGSFNTLQSATELMLEISWLSKAAKQTALQPSDVVLTPGENLGEVEVSTKDGQPLEILSVQSIDLNLYVEYTGAQLNNPLLWQDMGYGLLCWKLEPFTETVFTLPNPIDLPAGAPKGNWVYSNVIVKAGSLTADPTTFQANTLFPKPGPGSAVWADVNGNGIYDPGGKGGDKAISHIVICADLLTQSSAPSPTQTAGGTPAPTTPAPAPTQTSTPTPTQTSTPTPTPTATTPVPATPAPPLTPTPSATTTPTPTPTVSQTLCASPIPTNTTDRPRIAEPTPLPTITQNPVIRIEPLSTPRPTPPGGTVSPTPTPSPTQPGGSVTPTPTPSPTQPGVSPSPTPTNPGVTPSPTPTTPGTAAPSPTPTTPGNVDPSPTPTQPGGPGAPTPTIDLSSPTQCEPNFIFSVALKVSNGLSTTCLRVTSAYFNALAFAPRELPETDQVVTQEDQTDEVLADTGAETSALVLWALMLFGAGLVFTFLARRRV